MKQKKGILAFILSAVIIWLLSWLNPPFIGITIGGTTWVTILIIALVLGVINFVVVSIARAIFKKGSPGFMFIIALLIDAVALWLTALIMGSRFVMYGTWNGWLTTILTAFILALACSLAGLVKD